MMPMKKASEIHKPEGKVFFASLSMNLWVVAERVIASSDVQDIKCG